ncbi:MAG: hypothetical protein ACPG4X_18670 [Pikeienuella sp.]
MTKAKKTEREIELERVKKRRAISAKDAPGPIDRDEELARIKAKSVEKQISD